MLIYLRNTLVKFHTDPIWNDGAFGFLKSVDPNKKNSNKKKTRYGISSWSKKKIFYTYGAYIAYLKLYKTDLRY